jgi:hypothetical protein
VGLPLPPLGVYTSQLLRVGVDGALLVVMFVLLLDMGELTGVEPPVRTRLGREAVSITGWRIPAQPHSRTELECG